MADTIHIPISASPQNVKVIEIDAAAIAKIIMRKAHVREKPATAAANAVCDYLAVAFAGASPFRPN
jgi:hypothetical protein